MAFSFDFCDGTTNKLGSRNRCGAVLVAVLVSSQLLMYLLWSGNNCSLYQYNGKKRIVPVADILLKSHDWSLSIYEKEVDFLTNDRRENEDRVLELFLEFYARHCEKLRELRILRMGSQNDQPWCPCVPENLVGHQNSTKLLELHTDLNKTERIHREVPLGGHWRPPDCQPHQTIAIIIPYRNREIHLHAFLEYMIPFLQRQMIDFSLFVIEQGKPDIFNKAATMNAGYLEVKKIGTFDCYFFHDVDTLPEDDRNFYTCTENPRHLGLYISRHKYNPAFDNLVGGGVSFTDEQFQRINGFSNKYYGWGSEDNDAYYRILRSGMKVTRYPKAVARYTTLRHHRDTANPYNVNRTRLLNEIRRGKTYDFSKDGINTVNYTVREIIRTPLFTWIRVDLPPPPENYRFSKSPKYT